jgi:acyl transferase domain-containing protein/trans-aconitate methyltransferase
MSEPTRPDATLSPVKQALLEIRRLRALLVASGAPTAPAPGVTVTSPSASEPVAIVGMACRFPGGLSSPDAFWQAIASGVDAITTVPAERWDAAALFDASSRPGRSYSRHGGFLEHIDQFDAAFFNITPREAESMDPQHRMLLELSWEALEHAAIPPTALADGDAGVFIGLSASDYGRLVLAARDEIDSYASFGAAHSIAAGRISYALDLHGPSLVVDTACSSGLTAVHLACEALRNGKTGVALAGASNLMLGPESTISFSDAGMLARDGRCKAFDAAADGYVRGEGCAVVVLKRLRDALDDGDRVLAVIRGTAVNHDGRSAGLTAPNGPQQEAVIRAALRDGGVSPADVDYVETHGTGTKLGDPIELQALAAAYGDGRAADRPLLVGSVKTNIGHLEAAAGLAGLIKGVLALRHEALPPHRNFSTPNPLVAWERLPIEVVQTLRPWPRSDRPRRFGLSGFGFSGSNAHLVIEEAPSADHRDDPGDEHDELFLLSGRTPTALLTSASRMADWIAATDAPLGDICLSAATGRAHLAHRLVVVARDRAGLADALRRWVAGETSDAVRTGIAEGPPPRLGFLCPREFAGAAAQAHALRVGSSRLASMLDACAAAQVPAGGMPAGRETQALQIALGGFLIAAGVIPIVCIGVQSGELAAATLSGLPTPMADAPARRDVSFVSGRTGAIETAWRDWRGPGPWPVKLAAARQTARDAGADWLLVLGENNDFVSDAKSIALLSRSPDAAWRSVLRALGTLYLAGAALDWREVTRGEGRRRLALPPTCFERRRFWRPRGASPNVTDWPRLVTVVGRQSESGPLGWDVRNYPERWRRAEQLTAGYANNTLLALGAFATPGARASADELVRRHGLLPRLRGLVARWLKLLAREGVLQETDDGFVSSSPLRRRDVSETWRELDQLMADDPDTLAYARQASSRLVELLTGRLNPLEVLFAGGSFNNAEGIYERRPAARYLNGMVAAAVRAMLAERRGGAGFRLVEAGAGTGGATSALAEFFPTDGEYWFTDVSDAFLARARRNFGHNAAFHFARFNLEEVPPPELPIGRADVVLAANVVHATRDVGAALDRLRALLKPGGVLILVETTVHHSIFDLTIAFIEGWSSFADRFRREHPLLPPDRWISILEANGFEAAVRFPREGMAVDEIGQHVIIARNRTDALFPATTPAAAAVVRPQQSLLAKAPDAEMLRQPELLAEFVRRTAARVMQLDPKTQPGPRERFTDLGLDSLMALQLKAELAAGLELNDLPATIVFDAGTVEALTEQLRLIATPARSPEDLAPSRAPPYIPGRLTEAELASRTDEEVAALIASRFVRGGDLVSP